MIKQTLIAMSLFAATAFAHADPRADINQVGFGHGRYNVWVIPRASEDFPGSFGGDALYVIDAKELKILEKHFGR